MALEPVSFPASSAELLSTRKDGIAPDMQSFRGQDPSPPLTQEPYSLPSNPMPLAY